MKTTFKNITAGTIRAASYAFANPCAQSFLRASSRVANIFRGMGSGSSHRLSGQMQFLRRLGANSVIFDVGANTGQFAKEALSTCPEVILHSFEPSLAAYLLLQKNVGDKASIINCALGSEAGSSTLFAPEAGSALASLTKRRLDHFNTIVGHREEVQIQTIDDYCERTRIQLIHLLKVDVEGHEMSVFQGASKMFAARAIKTVMFEFGGANIDTRSFFQDFYYFFKNLAAARISRLTPSGWEAPVSKYSEDLECFTTTNYVVRFEHK